MTDTSKPDTAKNDAANFVPTPSRKPPVNEGGLWPIIKKNLFSGPISVIATPILAMIVAWVVVSALSWGVLRSTTHGASNLTCHMAERFELLSDKEVLATARDSLLISANYKKIKPETVAYLLGGSAADYADYPAAAKAKHDLHKPVERAVERLSFDQLMSPVMFAEPKVAFALKSRADVLKTLDKNVADVRKNSDPDATIHPDLEPVLAGMNMLALQSELKAAVDSKNPEAYISGLHKAAAGVHWGEANNGACWTVVKRRYQQFLVGFYPAEHKWRVGATALLLLIGGLSLLFPWHSYAVRAIPAAIIGALIGWLFISGLGLGGTAALLALAVPVVGALLFERLTTSWRALIFGLAFPFAAVWLLIRFSLPQALGWTSSTSSWIIGGLILALLTYFFVHSLRQQSQSKSFKPVTNIVYVILGMLTIYVYWTVRVTPEGDLTPLQTFLGNFRLEDVVVDNVWGGLLATAVTGLTGIAVSLPLGVVLALGRRSDLPIVSMFCTGFIEFVRGVPLITILFMASVLLPLFLPEGVTINKLLRALVGVSLFASAYMAEVIRGGLQGLSKGQTEGANSLGLSFWQTQRFIILPQALKISIPGIVNTFIGLYKDTTLLSIIGIFDLLGVGSRSVLPALEWTRLEAEVYGFIALFFFVSCFFMSRYSQYLERRLATGYDR